MDETVLVLRFGLGLLFVSHGVAKLAMRDQFREAVANYQLVPVRLIGVVASAVLFIELACGVMLVVGFAAPVAAVALAALLILFAVGIGINLLRGRSFDCGCSARGHTISWALVGRDLTLAAGATVIFVWAPQEFSVLPVSLLRTTELPAGDVIPAVGIALLIALVRGLLVAVSDYRTIARAISG